MKKHASEAEVRDVMRRSDEARRAVAGVRLCYECSGGYHAAALHGIERDCECVCRLKGAGTAGTIALIVWGFVWLALAFLVWTGRLP